MKVSYSYLKEQFANPDAILADVKKLVLSGDFTLGNALEEFEKSLAEFLGSKFAVGVGTGTDALRLSLIAAGVKPGDEVITAVNTFYSTAAAIATVGAKPVFVDVTDDLLMDVSLIEKVITKKTKAIIPVHLHGTPVDMKKIIAIAEAHKLVVIEDSCQSLGAEVHGKKAGTFGLTGCFSLHPLKPLNVWGDAGVVVTDSETVRDRLHLLRDNGLKNRDECEEYAFNCRMDTLQAVVGNHLIKDLDKILDAKIENSKYYDKEFVSVKQIRIPPREKDVKRVYHNYVLIVEDRDKILVFLREKGISAKIHYPIPLHLQKASKYLSYKKGDFPVAEEQTEKIISLPVHQHLTQEQKEFVVKTVKEFYK
ncbi:MAG: DegT/DnrJ/EryC1/StrS family aminotransferase [Nanoarchaeota archaeon]|nr:DegT/DnrJ/EryC1/StrS family aminotransferase [Nanoarchaeota archaeon]MBU1320877.1 DegT/DnrJ/EryC1/StrS family aminotransferase [Nanoarchaeota archaeon]MBU1597783.1 DegT/DnrJ/EryC1/StrS family aminotransferase [Nanoarchaeota archaeon]MBU2441234.1 DegT/DnrJ/EryC1/StrS family aminotransferase [Nanoarchaeota archaeon]